MSDCPQPDAMLAAADTALAATALALDRFRATSAWRQPFSAAAQALLAAPSPVLLVGVGKSGLIAAKIAATLTSTGTPAVFLHAGEALHGDAGLITRQAVAVVLSASGRTAEVLAVLPVLRGRGCTVVAITGSETADLAQRSDIVIPAPVLAEGDPLDAAPMASTTLALAVGDALAAALMTGRGFDAQAFHANHPGGRLGRALPARLGQVAAVMRTGSACPQVDPAQSLLDARLAAEGSGVVFLTRRGRLLGSVSLQSLRDALAGGNPAVTLSDLLDLTPTVTPDTPVHEARLRLAEAPAAAVVDSHGTLLGWVQRTDLATA